MYGYEIMHEKVAENLINNVHNGIANQAYIFKGEQGVGSMECAKLLAAALVCKHEEMAPCGKCNACIMAKAGSHPDISVIFRPEDKRNILVDQIRNVVTDAYTRPYESGKKVYILADEMNEQAQNAFLKMLEEPPEYAVFILLTENEESLLQTIRSRCATVKFNPVGDDAVREYVRNKYPEHAEKADFLVQYAGGVVGEIEKILDAENFESLRRMSFDSLEELMSPSLLDAYTVAKFIDENKEDADLILRFWLGFLRDVMYIRTGSKNLVKSTDFSDNLTRLSNKCDDKMVVRAIDEVLVAQKMRKRYVNLKALTLRLAFSIKDKEK